ncbi:glucuronate isomerase [Clostridium sp. BL-8]|nr:glucuronate isomerase [Clostridium sp. BL-8]
MLDNNYKWRPMRYAGVSEEFITCAATDLDKFKMWARTCERLIGNPL